MLQEVKHLACEADWSVRSMRGHGVLIESAIVLALSLPIAGIQLLADINTGLDPHPVTEVEGLIASKRSYTNGSGRSRTHHKELTLQTEDETYPYSRTLEVGPSLYRDAARGRTVVLEVGQGGVPMQRYVIGSGWVNTPW